MDIDNLQNADEVEDGCGKKIREYMHIEHCYVCYSTVIGGGSICFVCISYLLIGLNWNGATCRTFSDTRCFDHTDDPEVVYNLRNMDRWIIVS